MTETGAQETKVVRRQRAPITEAPEPGALSEFDRLMRAAEFYSKADILPETYKGKPANVLICMEIAHRVGQHWLAVAQNLYMVKGRPAWMTSYLIGLANVQNVFAEPITWTDEGTGDDLVVTAHAKLTNWNMPVHVPVSMKEAKADGWVERNAKYKSLPKLMLQYRSASRLIRLYAPQVQHGMTTVEEVEDSPEQREVKVLDVQTLQLTKPRIELVDEKPPDLPQDASAAAPRPEPTPPAQEEQAAKPGAETVAPGALDLLLEQLDTVAAIKKISSSELLVGCCERLQLGSNPLLVKVKDFPRLHAEVGKLIRNVTANAKVAAS